MPNRTSQLFLQITGSSDGLTKAAKAARVSMADLGQASGDLQQVVASNFAKLGGSSLAQSAREMERQFRQSLEGIRSAAQDTLSKPVTAATVVSTNIRGQEAALANAEALASTYRALADAQAGLIASSTAVSEAELRLGVALETQALAAKEDVVAIEKQLEILRQLGSALGVTAGRENEAAAAHNRVGASGLIADHVIRSFTDSVAAGQSPIRAFSMELPRVAEAMQLMALSTNNTGGAMGKFAAFMGSGFGIAITAGIALLSPLVGKLFEAEDALKAATLGNDGLSEAQGALGKMFDLTSGKLEHQNELLRVNARITAANLRIQATNAETSSKKTFAEAGTRSFGDQASGFFSALRDPDTGLAPTDAPSTAQTKGTRNTRVLGRISAQVQSGKLSFEDAVKLTEKADFRGTDTDKSKFLQALGDAASVKILRQTADMVDSTLDTGKLAQGLRRTDRRKPKVDRSSEKAASEDKTFQTQLRSEQDAYAKLMEQLSQTAQQRYDIAIAQIGADLDTKNTAIDDQVKEHKLRGDHAAILKAGNEQIAQAQRDAKKRELNSQLTDEALAKSLLGIQGQLDLNAIDTQLASTRRQRLALELDRLKLERDKSIAEQQAIIAKAQPGAEEAKNAQTRIGQINANYVGSVAVTQREHADPLQSYRQKLQDSVGDIGDDLSNFKVDAIEHLGDSLDSAATKALKLHGLFGDLASDLLKLLIQREIELPIANFLTGGGGGPGGGSSGGLFGGLLKGAGKLFHIPGFATGTDNAPGGMALVGENGPELVNLPRGSSVTPSAKTLSMLSGIAVPSRVRDLSPADARSLAASRPAQVVLHVEANDYFDARVGSISGAHVQAAAPGTAAAGAQMAQQDAARRQRRRLGS